MSVKKRKKMGRGSRSIGRRGACVDVVEEVGLRGSLHGGRRVGGAARKLPRARALARSGHGGRNEGVGVETYLGGIEGRRGSERIEERPG